MNLEGRAELCADALKARSHDLIDRKACIDHLEALRSDVVAELNIDQLRCRVRHIACAGCDPIPHDLCRRLEPKPGERDALLCGEGGEGLALLLLRVYG